MTPEAKFWNWLKPHLKGHVQRIENSIERGTPDVNICHEGKEIWLELKVPKSSNCVDIRKEQRVWAVRRSLAGGKVFVLARNESGILSAWRMPVVTVTVNDTYQRICENPHFFSPRIEDVTNWIYA